VHFFHNNLRRSDQLYVHVNTKSSTNYATKAYVETEKHHAFQALELDGSKLMLKWRRQTIRKIEGIDGRVLLQSNLKNKMKRRGMDCSGSRNGTRGQLLWTRRRTFGFHKMWKISWLAEQLSASI